MKRSMKAVEQPRPHFSGLLRFQNGGRRNRWTRLSKYSMNRGVFCHVTHNEMAFLKLFSAIGSRVLLQSEVVFSQQTKTFRHVLRDKTVQDVWSQF